MLDEFKTFLEETRLFQQQPKVLLAISGGIDSVVMAHLFYRAHIPFDIVHCNFQLRGEESDGDEAFVRQLAEKFDVQCMVSSFETQQYADANQLSIQMAARDLRYQWFEELLQTHDHVYLATAHHKHDVLETMIFNLAKGTGLAGMHGIRFLQGQIIRPMLFTDRKQIEGYASAEKLHWREDSSNADDKYRRNLIRHEVIPVLEQINPSLMKTLEPTLERFMGAEAVVQAASEQVMKECIIVEKNDIYISLPKIHALPGLKVLLHEILKDYGFHYQQTREIVAMLQDEERSAHVGKVFDSATHRLNFDRNDLIISPIPVMQPAKTSVISEKEHEKHLDQFDLDIKVLDARKYNVMPLANIAALDHEKLKFPLKLRKWKKGDSFYPLGMNCKKKLSDFMVDTKIPLNLKDRVFVLTSGEDIVWVVGHRIDHRYRITNKTRQVYELTQHVRI